MTVIRYMPRLIEAALRHRGGNTAIVFALLLPALLLVVGAGTDYATAVGEKSKAQHAVDAAALAGAKELSLADSNRENISQVVKSVVDATFDTNRQRAGNTTYDVKTIVSHHPGSPLQVQVNLTGQLASSFGKSFGLGAMSVTASSVAIVVGKPNICLLALDTSSMGTIYLQKNAKIVGQNCAVFSNSRHPNGIKAFNSSVLQATTICSAGGKAGSKGNFTPEPLTDCPQFEDPLAGRPEPAVAGCTQTNVVIDSVTTTLDPGTYCGGLVVKGSARVTLQPGLYIMSNGPLSVADTATFEGSNTSFYLTGAKSSFSFAPGTTVNLTAQKDGPLAGLLFFASRSQSGLVHQISSDNARELLGTIYLPTGEISIDANQPIADKSAYTAIVALKVTGNAGPTVTLNTNYDQTDVPVPEGIRGAGQPVALYK